MNHSLFMLANNRLFKKGQYDKLLKVSIIIVIISNILGITSLFIYGFSYIEYIILKIFLLVPLIIGIIMFIIRVYYRNKSKALKEESESKYKRKRYKKK